MKQLVNQREGGFVLVFTLLLLVVVTLLGVSAVDTSVFESAMTANDALYKRAFYQADGGANVAGVVIEENVSCPKGFQAMPAYSGDALLGGNVLVESTSLRLWDNPTSAAGRPSDTNRDGYFFYDPSDMNGIRHPRNNIRLGGKTVITPGSALQMAAGYEGRGKGMANGGAYITYDVFSQHIGDRLSESVVEIIWRHVIGFEGNCRY